MVSVGRCVLPQRVPDMDDRLRPRIVFLSFLKDVNPNDHPFYKYVYIRLMPMNEVKPRVVAYVYGGQGTINVPSWSPDSKRIAFVSNSQH
jgi:hypothetical protein